MSTINNLKEAFAGESQANHKYMAFAKKADEEGYEQVAKLFRAAAEAEAVHAQNHLMVMDGIGSTAENLKSAILGEEEEFEAMYPEFIKEAKSEDNNQAVWTFDVANQVEQIHAELYAKALEVLGNNEKVDYYVCGHCGNTVENEAPDVCPICGALKSEFMKIE
ncbi:MAG: rubrerythrin family protein [Methanobacterium sp.]|jgi:rubrerythrin|nr:rubrerythrin family protein [Methanobacterium sp.]